MKHVIYAALSMVFLLAACANPAQKTGNGDVINLIMETDIGNDVDDALALDMLYKYIDAKQINLLAININKEGTAPAEFTDLMNTWYGHPDIPIGTIKEGADCENDAVNYARVVASMKDTDGNAVFHRSVSDVSTLPDAVSLYRKILAGMPDQSVTIVSVGFSTNLIRLLATEGDAVSPLSGKELIARKVCKLVTMAGCFDKEDFAEYNVHKDIPAARVVFEEWPTPVITSPFEVGNAICYPGSSIENDFGWAEGPHPLVEAYKSYLPMPYDRPTWDLTAVLYAVEGDAWFTMSPAGVIRVTEEGFTHFTASEQGNRYYMQTSPEQAAAIKKHFITLITSKPASR